MKKLLILTTFLSSLLITSLAHAEWTQVAKSVNGSTYYVDFSRIRNRDGRVYFWMLSDLSKPRENGTMSSKIYVEVECGSFRSRWLNDTYYKGSMASGEVLHSNNTPEKNWIYPSPNSVDEGVLKAVCNHKSMQ